MKHDFEERRQRRIENAQNQAKKNKQAARDYEKKASQMASAIPMGQPILIGHHSEQRDRRNRSQLHNTFGKSVEANRKAGYYADKAECIANNKAISSDDPQAIEKLEAKLATLKNLQEFMKAANKYIKKQDKDAFLKLEYGGEDLWLQLNTPDCMKDNGFPQYKLSNNDANIRRIEERLAGLKRQADSTAVIDKVINGVRIFENKEANRLQLFFEGKPADEIRRKLKASGFRWSPGEGAWQSYISRQALYNAELIAESIEKA